MDASDANSYISTVLFSPANSNISAKRTISEVSSESESSSPPNKMASTENKSDEHDDVPCNITSVKSLLSELATEFRCEFADLRKEIKDLKGKMCTESHLKHVKDDIMIEVSGVRLSVKSINTKFNDMRSEYDNRIAELEQQILNLNGCKCEENSSVCQVFD